MSDASSVKTALAEATVKAGRVDTSFSVTTATSLSLDRRSLRSRKMMHDAVAELLTERGFGNFTISDLMNKADLNRSTFYGHYLSLEDLLTQMKREIVNDLSSLKPLIVSVSLKDVFTFQLTGTPPAVTVLLFDILHDHGRLLGGLLCPSGDAHFQAELRDEVCASFIRSILNKKYTQSPSALVEYYIRYYSSALLGLIQRWLEGGMVESSAEMARIMLTIMSLQLGDSITLKGKE